MGQYRDAVAATVKKWLTSKLPEPVVDLGGRGYREWMAGLISQPFETWDYIAARDVTRVVDAMHMRDIKSASVGSVVCVSALEHFEKPWAAAAQIARVVRPGGLLFVSAPFVFPFHEEPHDYWRYTPDALRVLFGPAFTETFCGWEGKHQSVFYGRRKPAADIKAALKVAEKITGLTTTEEAEFIFRCATQSVAGGEFVELGTYLGRSCSVLCHVAAGRGLIPTTIDNYLYRLENNAHETWRNLVAYGLNANVIHGYTTDIPDGVKAVSVLFVDSTHTAEHFAKEMAAWLPLVKKGGVVICHDYSSPEWPEMRPAIDSQFARGWKALGTSGRAIGFKRL